MLLHASMFRVAIPIFNGEPSLAGLLQKVLLLYALKVSVKKAGFKREPHSLLLGISKPAAHWIVAKTCESTVQAARRF